MDKAGMKEIFDFLSRAKALLSQSKIIFYARLIHI